MDAGRRMPLKRNRTRWDDALSRIDPTCFEALLADHYRAEGWSVEHVGADATGRAYDGGIDLKLRRGDEYVVVQCKRWNAMQVPHTDVHQLIGVMVTQRATGAVFVTCGEYTHAAVTAANRQPNLQLVDGAMVREWIDIAALEAEACSTKPEGSDAANAWAQAVAERRSTRRPRRIAENDKGIYILAAAGIAVLWVSVLFLPSRQLEPVAPETAHTPTERVAPASPLAPVDRADSPAPSEPARAGRLTALAQPINRAATEYLRQASIPDVMRPVDHEAARMAAKAVPGVRTALWLDRENFVVMVDGSQYRSMAMIDQVCVALEPLGDTLAVVVNVQDMTAQHADGATTLSRNCQLLEGQRAFLQRKRQVDVVAPAAKRSFRGR